MKLTTQNIIKALPIEPALKQQVLEGWESMETSRKFALEQFIWDTYYALYQLRLQENLQQGMLRARENKETLDSSFYQRIQEQTEKDMEKEESVTQTQGELTQVREKLEALLQK